MKPAANLVTTSMSTTETEVMTKAPSSQESQCCPLSLHQKIIKTFNWILLVSGLVLLAIFLWTFIGHASFLAIIPNLTYKIVLYMTLASSVAILVTFILGIIGVSLTKGKKCIFFLYVFFLILIWMTEVVVGMLSYTYYQDVRNDLSENLPLTLQTHYLTDPVMSQQIDWIQSRLRCCGANSPEDWNQSGWRLEVWSPDIEAVPESCCKTPTSKECGLRIHPSSISFTGCVHPMSLHIQERLLVLASVALGLSIFHMCGIFGTLCLLCNISSQEEKDKIRSSKLELENSRFTRNQHQFNLLQSNGSERHQK